MFVEYEMDLFELDADEIYYPHFRLKYKMDGF